MSGQDDTVNLKLSLTPTFFLSIDLFSENYYLSSGLGYVRAQRKKIEQDKTSRSTVLGSAGCFEVQ